MWDQKQRITTAHRLWLFCPKSSCYTKFPGSKQHGTLLLWLPAVGSLHTLAEEASELGGLTLPGSWELPQGRRSCTWLRTDLVFKLLIHHDNEDYGAGLKGCCPVKHAGSQILGDEGRIRCSPGRNGDRGDPQNSSNLVVEWASVRSETWWSCQGISFSGKARSFLALHEASCRNKYTFALAGFSLKSWSGSWSVSSEDPGNWWEASRNSCKKLPKYIWSA